MGTFSPGRTRTVSPTFRELVGTSITLPSSLSRFAVGGISFTSSRSAPVAPRMDLISIQWPKSRKRTSVDISQ